MTTVTMRERIGASRGKLALVGVLAVVLVVVIVGQLPDSSNTDEALTASVSSISGLEAVAGEGGESARVPLTSEENPESKPPREWPELSMDAISAFDPMTAPSWYLVAARAEQSTEQTDLTQVSTEDEERAAALVSLQQAGATIVLIANGERIATIGEQRIRIGDNIEGYQVSDITGQGVILTKPRSK